MLSKLKIELDYDKDKLGYKFGPKFHGALMEIIDSDYADYLHQNQLHPYSQNILRDDDTVYWCLNSLDENSYNKIIKKVFSIESIELMIDGNATKIPFKKKNLTTINRNKLIDDFNGKPASSEISISFVTPTAFKSEGQYLIFPTVRHLFQSLINKYNAALGDFEYVDQELLNELESKCFINWYRLRSSKYFVGSACVSAFIGDITIRFKGAETLSGYARMLFEFGQYSGVGIKTSLGMGSLKIRSVRG